MSKERNEVQTIKRKKERMNEGKKFTFIEHFYRAEKEEDAHVPVSSKMVSMRSGKPACAPSRF